MKMSDQENDLLEFIEFVDMLVEENNFRIPKRYIRNMENPLEFYSEGDFRDRYRFTKNTVVNTILPLVSDGLIKVNNRGLPFSPIIQLLTCLRFYATGNFQVSNFVYKSLFHLLFILLNNGLLILRLYRVIYEGLANSLLAELLKEYQCHLLNGLVNLSNSQQRKMDSDKI